MTHFGAFILAVAMAGGVLTQESKDNPGAVALQGTWVLTTVNGQSAEGGPPLTLTFAGDKYHQTVGGDVNERGTFKIDSSKTPMAIDLTIVEGDDAGKTQLGILQVTGETLQVAFDTPGRGQRPTDFTIKEGVLVASARKTKP